MACTARTSAAERTKLWAMKSMSWSMASMMFLRSFGVSAGSAMWRPGTLTLLWAPSTPSFVTWAMTAGPLMPMTSMSSAPSSKSTWSPSCTSAAKFLYDTLTMSWVESTSGRPKSLTTSPVLYSIGSAHPVVRTSGPLVSMSRPICRLTARVFLIIFFIPSSEAWAVFMRTTFMPALKSWRRKSVSQRRSLTEATIFVCFITWKIVFVGAKLQKKRGFMKKKHGKFPYLVEKQYLCSPKIK